MTTKPAHFEVYLDHAGEYRARFVAVNSEKVWVTSEGYAAKGDCLHAIDLVVGVTVDTPVEDETA
jgi:uncharacterized protein YegP (UPF0339 family)